MEKSCPACNSRDARIRRDWYRRSNALRCRSCNGVFGKTLIKRCPAVLLGGGVPDLQKLLEAARADGCPDLVAEAREAGVPTAFLENATRGRSSPGDTKWMRGNRGSNGHTVLAMQAGLWAATTPLAFEDALVALVSSGGDTDTNGALAGAVLGARYGAAAIPPRWITNVAQRERLTNLADRLAQL